MLTTFSGLDAQASAALLSRVAPGAEVRHVAGQELMGLQRLNRAGRVVWLYRAPWALVCQQGASSVSVAQALHQWLDVHRALLRKRRTLGKQLLLVNADGLDAAALLASLELAVAPETVQTAASGQDGESDASVTAIVAQVFESLAPEYADVFHALEALSWQTQEGHASHEHAALSDEAVLQVFQMLADSQAVPGMSAALSKAQSEVLKHAAAAADAALTLAKSQAAEKVAQSKAAAAEQVAANEGKRLQAELEKLKAELAQAKKQAAAVQAQAQAEKATTEQHARDRAELEKLKAELAQAKQQSAAVQAKAQRETTEQRTRAQAELEKVQAELKDLKELQSENEMLLMHMHQVQEDLERYFLENRELQKVVTESQGSLDRARKVISKFMLVTGAKPTPLPDSASTLAPGNA